MKISNELQCPACDDKWQEIRNAVRQFSQTLKDLEKYRVCFRVPAPPAAADKKG